MTEKKGQLIVALDVETFKEALQLLDTLKEDVDIFKVGSQLFTACGPVIIRHILARGKKVFVDLKFHDIPNTVAGAVQSLITVSAPVHDVLNERKEKVAVAEGIFMCTLHTLGGRDMLVKAVEAATKASEKYKVTKPLLVGITVLTSDEKRDNILDLVLERAQLAKESGLDGVVASSEEAGAIRREFGEDFVIVTPGIRPAGAAAGDQKRVTTPAEAIHNGSNFIVVGRPIVQAPNPLEAAKAILQEIK